jgi:hypothetical protein
MLIKVTQRPAVILPGEHGSNPPPRSILDVCCAPLNLLLCAEMCTQLSALDVPNRLALGAATKEKDEASGREQVKNTRNGAWYKSVWERVKRTRAPSESIPDDHNISQHKKRSGQVKLTEVAAARGKQVSQLLLGTVSNDSDQRLFVTAKPGTAETPAVSLGQCPFRRPHK